MDSLYTEIILEHNKSKHNFREIIEADVSERGHNPNCGDDLTLQLKVENGVITEAAYIGYGCAISKASMSIMIDIIINQKIEKAMELAKFFLDMVRGKELSKNELEKLEDASIFESLKKMPARVKCGTLSWHCLSQCLEKIEEYNNEN